MAKFGKPEIFNTDQGSQFTSPRFVEVLTGAGVQVSMDGKGRWMDNVFIERLWRSLKYECVYIHAFEIGVELRMGLARWITYYNADRPHTFWRGHPQWRHMIEHALSLIRRSPQIKLNPHSNFRHKNEHLTPAYPSRIPVRRLGAISGWAEHFIPSKIRFQFMSGCLSIFGTR